MKEVFCVPARRNGGTHRVRCLALLALAAALGEASAYASPARLRLRVESSTLREGESTRVVIEFLDREYRGVANDRDRVVRLEPQGARAGEISPSRVVVPAGARSYADVTYTARGSGRVVIRAASEGLVPAEAVLVVTARGASVLSRLFFAPVHAQAPGRLEIYPPNLDPLPANGISRARLSVVLDGPVAAGVGLLALVTTNPPVQVRYGGVEKLGFTQLTIPEGQAVSEEIQILSSRAGAVRVSAKALPAGPKHEVRVEFVKPRAAGIAFDFEGERPTIRPYASGLPADVLLVDQDGAKIDAPAGSHLIECTSSTDPDVATLEPRVFELSPSRPVVRTSLRLRGLPKGREVGLLARDESGTLKPGEVAVGIDSLIRAVKIVGPAEVHSGAKDYSFTLRLVDAAGSPQAADWDRDIRLFAQRGRFVPERVRIPRDADEAQVTYRSPKDSGPESIRAESRGLGSEQVPVEVLVSGPALVLWALFGGVLGGLARHVYRVQTPVVLPRRVRGRLEPGLVGNGLFSALFGLVFFQAVEFSIHNPAWPAGGFPENRALAFFLGVLGGFAGVLALDRFVNFVLPAPREPAAVAPEP